MTQEQKDLLLKDLCARLPYNPLVDVAYLNGARCKFAFVNTPLIRDFICEDLVYVKPYLRPMSSMTEEEKQEYLTECDKDDEDSITTPRYHGIEWLNKNGFDYRGLIPMGLAIEGNRRK